MEVNALVPSISLTRSRLSSSAMLLTVPAARSLPRPAWLDEARVLAYAPAGPEKTVAWRATPAFRPPAATGPFRRFSGRGRKGSTQSANLDTSPPGAIVVPLPWTRGEGRRRVGLRHGLDGGLAPCLRTGRLDVRGQPFPRGEQLLLIDDVVAIEHCARLVSGEEHCHALWHASTDQVTRGRPPTVVQEPRRNLGLPTCITERGAPRAHWYAVPREHARALRMPLAKASLEDLLQRF